MHLGAGTAGVGFGTEAFRAGPYASLGILIAGIGVRALWTPWESRNGARHGLELRGTYYTPSTPAGGVMLAYAWKMGSLR